MRYSRAFLLLDSIFAIFIASIAYIGIVQIQEKIALESSRSDISLLSEAKRNLARNIDSDIFTEETIISKNGYRYRFKSFKGASSVDEGNNAREYIVLHKLEPKN